MVTPFSRAATILWQGGTADYNIAADWVGGSVPGAGDSAINDNGTNNVVEINPGDPDWTLTDLRAGNGLGNGAYVQNGQTITLSGWFRLGVASGNIGIYTLNGGAINYQGGEFNVGELGSGILNIHGGFITGSGNFADNLGGSTNTDFVNQTSGTVNITGGGQFFVGNAGAGIYHLSGGSINVHNYIAFGRTSGNGTFQMTGGTLNQDGGGNLLIGTGYNNNGSPATGVLDQSGGTINCQGQFLCPETAPSTGTYNLSGTGRLIVNNWIAFGRGAAVGTLNMSGGSIIKTGNNSTHLDVGASGPGTINQFGGVITNTMSDTWIGESTNGTWNLHGGSAVLGKLILGVNSGASGTLDLTGGQITTTEITSGSGTNDILRLNGGILRAGANDVDLIHGLKLATIGASGITLDSAGNDVNIGQPLLDNGGGPLIKTGAGNITLSGANTYRGNNIIEAGKLILSTSSTGGGSFIVENGAGMGVMVGSAHAQLNPPNVALGSSATTSVDFDLGSFGNPTNAPLNVTGTLAVNSAVTININSNSVMQVGEFPLIQYSSRIGSGSFLIGNLPGGTQAQLVTNAASHSIDLVVTKAPLVGVISANFDGQGQTGWSPPDANAAVGPDYIVCWGNNSLMILDKLGKVISSQDANQFFGFSTGGDGHVIYDEISHRFALEVLSTNNSVGFAVSDTPNPTGSWHKIRIPVPGLWDGYGGNGIGYNADAYVVHVNGFNNQYAVVAASNNVSLAYSLVTAPSNVRIGRPAPMAGASHGGPFYFVEGNDDGVNGTGGTPGNIEVVKISNILSAGRTYTDYQVPATSGEASVINVAWRNNLLAVTGSTGTPAVVNWYLLSTSNNPSLLQSGTIVPENNGDADVPSIGIAPNDSLAVNYTVAYPGKNGSSLTTMYVAGRLATDPAGTMRAPRQIITGPTTDGRWGDYSSCVTDVNSSGVPQNSFWACNEYLTSPGMFNWKDRLANFSIPTVLSNEVAGSLYVDLRASDLASETILWTNRAGTGNFASDGTAAPKFTFYQGFPAVWLNGSSGYKGPETTASLLSGRAPRSIAVWVNNPSISDEETMVALGKRGSTDQNFAFNYGSDVNWGALAMYNDDIGWKTEPLADNWHYLVVTYDGTNLAVYEDGTLDNSAQRTAATPIDPIWVGSQTTDGINPSVGWFTGYLNSIRIYTGVLSPSQIAANYACGPVTMPLPLVPTGLAAMPDATHVQLSWTASAHATGYNILRSTKSSGLYLPLANSSAPSYSDAAVTNGATYYYAISATNAAGTSALSAPASATMPLVMLNVSSHTNGNFTLHFDAADNQTFVIEASTNLLNWIPVATNKPLAGVVNFTDTNASLPARFYRIRN